MICPAAASIRSRRSLSSARLVVIAGIVLVPLLATALGGFKELGELRSNLLGLPHVWVWQNYWGILSGARYCRCSAIR